jgi:hypothetical protein
VSATLAASLLPLHPIETPPRVHALFESWRRALATDKRFSTMAKSLKPETPPLPSAAKGGYEWRATLRPSGLPAGLDFVIRLVDKSASYTPLDRNSQAAFGVDGTDGATYVLRQWYDTKRIGSSRPLNAEALAQFEAPPSAVLFHAPSQPDAGRGRLYLIVAKLTAPPEEIAEQTFNAMAGFHRVAAAAREAAW